jgi:hypothetical protein
MTAQLIHMRNVPGTDNERALDAPLPLLMQDGTMAEVPADFVWDGNSVPMVFRGIFPKHNHPIASCRHDWRCIMARSAADRKFADEQFQVDVGTTGWWITKKIGYIGVRIGALFGRGSNYGKESDNEDINHARSNAGY